MENWSSHDSIKTEAKNNEKTAQKLRPDFSFIDPAGDVIIWEHLGMLSMEDYRVGWEWKKRWYSENGFIVENNLFTTEDDPKGGLNAVQVKEIALKIKDKL